MKLWKKLNKKNNIYAYIERLLYCSQFDTSLDSNIYIARASYIYTSLLILYLQFRPCTAMHFKIHLFSHHLHACILLPSFFFLLLTQCLTFFSSLHWTLPTSSRTIFSTFSNKPNGIVWNFPLDYNEFENFMPRNKIC